MTALDRHSIRRGVVLLEDALRTAAAPGPLLGRCVFVRSVNLGVFSPRSSPATLALRIEKALAAAAGRAVHALSPGASGAPAVYFRDDGEAVAELLVRLAGGASPSEWFWAKAVPGWTRTTPRREGIRLCWRQILGDQGSAVPPVASAATLVARLHAVNRADAILEVLEPEIGAALLAWAGLRADLFATALPREPVNVPEDLIALPVRSALLLSRWAGRWGAADARTLWLAALVVRSDVPAVELSPTPEAVIARYLAQALRGQVAPAARDRQPRAQANGGSERASLQPRPAPAGVPRSDSEPITHPDTPPHLRPDAPPPQAPVPSDFPPDQHSPAPTGHVPEAHAAHRPDRPDDAGALRRPMTAAVSALQQESSYAGLFFLAALFERLGLAAFLERHPHLLEADFGRRLLSYSAERLHVPPSDCLLLAIWNEEEPSRDQPFRSSFVAPPKWEPLWFNGPCRIARASPSSGRRILFDGSGRLALAQWSGVRPDGAKGPVSKRGLLRRPPVDESAETVLFRAWMEAARRWSRRYARSSLTRIVRRTARVVSSRTHIDIMFRLVQADVRIRLAALDVDPGWTPWLGKVVRFHYLSDEEFSHGSLV